jgi:hypothetical protein
MPKDRDDLLRIALTEAAERLVAEPKPFIVLFERGDFSVELFAPRGSDTQQPHDQDEAYIVASGSGTFRRGEERVPFQQGDFLFWPLESRIGLRNSQTTFRPGCCSSGRRAASVVSGQPAGAGARRSPAVRAGSSLPPGLMGGRHRRLASNESVAMVSADLRGYACDERADQH